MVIQFNFDRNKLIKHLPSGICAEIGVAEGVFSKTIAIHKPKKLYLIDAWKSFDVGYDDTNINLLSDNQHEMRFKSVTKMFSNHSNVEVVREMSGSAAAMFDNQYFDWIFIDADHSYEGCLSDLNAYKNKVKDNGFICGHDWLNNNKTKNGYGVNQAVIDFTTENNFHFIGHTNEPKFASYVIAKSNQIAEEFLTSYG